MRKEMKGSFTVEASFIIPLFLSVFIVSIYSLFYYHDKNLIGAAAYETVSYGSHENVGDADELEAYFQRQVGKRTLLFASVTAIVEIDEEKVEIACDAKKNGMRIRIHKEMCKTSPEKMIRNIRKIEKLGELK